MEEGEPEGGNYHADRDDDDEEHLAGALEALYARLQLNDSVVHIDEQTLDSWVQLHDSSEAALSNEEEEPDLERIDKKIVERLRDAAVTPPLPQFNSTTWPTHLEYLEELIHRARLAPHRAELLELLGDWQAGSTRISSPLKRVEELIDDDVLMPDVLMVHGDYEMYGHYNGGDY